MFIFIIIAAIFIFIGLRKYKNKYANAHKPTPSAYNYEKEQQLRSLEVYKGYSLEANGAHFKNGSNSSNSKNTAYFEALKITDCEVEFNIRTREWADNVFARIGFITDFKTGYKKFDDKFFIECESPIVANLIQNNLSIADKIIELFETGYLYSIQVSNRDILNIITNGRNSINFNFNLINKGILKALSTNELELLKNLDEKIIIMDEFIELIDKIKIEKVLIDGVEKLKSSDINLSVNIDYSKNIEHKTKNVKIISWIFVATTFFLVPFIGFFEDYLFDSVSQVFSFSIKIAIYISVVLSIIASEYIGKSVKRHLSIASFFITSVAFFMAITTFLYFYTNIKYDDSPAEIKKYSVVHKHKVWHSGSGRNSNGHYSYYVDVVDVNNGSRITFNRGDLYDKFYKDDVFLVEYKHGKFDIGYLNFKTVKLEK